MTAVYLHTTVTTVAGNIRIAHTLRFTVKALLPGKHSCTALTLGTNIPPLRYDSAYHSAWLLSESLLHYCN